MSNYINLPTGVITVLLAIPLLTLYLKLTTGRCKSKVKLHGKTAIITGANAGIGYETAIDFAKRGARVILACRNPESGKEAEKNIIKETGNKNVIFKLLDVSSFQSIKQFVQEIKKSEKRLDILVNNAGAVELPLQKTEERLLLVMQTNYFGPFLLTILLLDLIKKTSNSRIVNVSSMAGQYSKLDLNELNSIPESGIMKKMTAYARTKLCNILFTIELARRLKGTSVTTYSLHPGAVKTSIFKNQGLLQKFFTKFILRPFLKNARDGAETTIYCSIVEGIENLSGEHFHDCHVVKRYKSAQDPELPEKLWKTTEKLLNL